MQKVIILIIGSLLSAVAYAGSEIHVQGHHAERLLSALTDAGSYMDCGAGTCGTQAQNVQCSIKSRAHHQHFSCTMTAEDDTGGMSAMTATGTKAKTLFKRLAAAGLHPECASGVCVISPSAMTCLMHGNSVDERTYECTISP